MCPPAAPTIWAGVDVSTMDDDQQAEIRNKMLGFIFQQYNLIPKLTVLENVELPLLYAGVAARGAAGAGHGGPGAGWAWLTSSKNLPSQLSGGQQQRVSIARALAGNPVGDSGGRAHRRAGFPDGPGGAGLPPEAECRRGIPWCSSPTITPSPSRPSASSAFRTAASSMTVTPPIPPAVVQPEETGADGEVGV